MLTDVIKVIDGGITQPQGFYASGLHCGIKKKKMDLAWCYSEVPAVAAAVYTTNKFPAAPLTVTRSSIEVENKIQAILVNSGVANACTGSQGLADARETQSLVAKKFDIPEHYVAVSSTGVIGNLLPMDKIADGISQIQNWNQIKASLDFEEAIMTTDIVRKRACVQLTIDGELITIGGVAKGSGMINPNMATMLSYITTDAKIDFSSLQELLCQATDHTFNMIAVDGDTSTNDTVLALANGLAGNDSLNLHHPQWETFVIAFTYVARELAKQIARDGEGATKLIEVKVSGAMNLAQAKTIGKTVIMSSLVKTAIFGADPNWGRIVCALGYSDTDFEPDLVSIMLGDIKVFANGMPVKFDFEAAKEYLKNSTVIIEIDLGLGKAEALAWGCDLTYDYVKINAAYHT